MKHSIIGIAMGDPAGIGPEVAVKALMSPEVRQTCRPVLIGSRDVFQRAVHQFCPNIVLETVRTLDRIDSSQAVPVLDCTDFRTEQIQRGQLSLLGARAAILSVREAVTLALSGKIDAVVTAPISKRAAHLAGFTYPGQTELLADLTETKKFAMMLTNDRLRVVLVTTHVPLSMVGQSLTVELIFDKLFIAHRALRKFFLVRSPRLAVSALNPHAGEGGIFGEEEKIVIRPAIEKARQRGIEADGPFPADTLFTPEFFPRFDAVLAMYHDQGLIPVKLTGFGSSVNVTIGLPIIRTSPDHGTAFDIAWRGEANPGSMIRAISMAIDMARGRGLK